MPARNSQSPKKSKLFGRRPEMLGAGKVNSRQIRRGSSREDRSKRSPTPSESGSRHHLSVCLGRGDVGYIDQVSRTYTAKTLDGQSLGVFVDLRSAADAVSTAALRAQAVDAQCCKANPGVALVGLPTMPKSGPRRPQELNATKRGFAASAQKVDC
jgi:hypothetical protein